MQTAKIRRPYMPELDTLRGVAVLLVFAFHATLGFSFTGLELWQHALVLLTRGGWAGVNLFFVLSGFLITGILLGSVSKPRYYARFYSRRARRILPAYWTLLALLLFVSRFAAVHRHVTLAFAGLSALFLANVTPLIGVSMDYAPLWSLAVEEHFYLLWPATVKHLTRKALATIAIAICIAELLLRVYCFHRGRLWFGPYTWLSADGLALGALLAIFASSTHARRANLIRISAVALMLTAAQMLLSMLSSRAWTVALRGTAVNYFALFAVAAALWLGTGSLHSWVNLRVLRFMGYISYGFYLLHVLAFNLFDSMIEVVAPTLAHQQTFLYASFRAAAVFLLTVAVAYLSRQTLEKFFLEEKSVPQVLKEATALNAISSGD